MNICYPETKKTRVTTALQTSLLRWLGHGTLKTLKNSNCTLPKFNSSPLKNGWLECYFPIGFRPIFRGHVSFREGNICHFPQGTSTFFLLFTRVEKTFFSGSKLPWILPWYKGQESQKNTNPRSWSPPFFSTKTIFILEFFRTKTLLAPLMGGSDCGGMGKMGWMGKKIVETTSLDLCVFTSILIPYIFPNPLNIGGFPLKISLKNSSFFCLFRFLGEFDEWLLFLFFFAKSVVAPQIKMQKSSSPLVWR